MSAAREKGQAFLSELLAYVPEEKRADVQAALEGSEQVLTTLGAATLRQSDYSRSMDETNAYKRQLDEWFAENQVRLTEAERLRAGGITPPASTQTPQPTAPAGLTKEEVEAMLATREQAAIAAIVHTNELAGKHFKTFGEPLDIQALMKDPEISRLGLPGVYQKVYQPKYDEIAKAAEQKRIDGLVAAQLIEERKKFQTMPYPVSGREGPSALDAIEAQLRNPLDPSKPIVPAVGSVNVVDEAVAQYNDAVNRREGVPA